MGRDVDVCGGLEQPRRWLVPGGEKGAGEGLGVRRHLLPHLLLRPDPTLRRGWVREEAPRGLVTRGDEGAGERAGVDVHLLPHLRLRRVPALEGLHEERLHGCHGGGGRSV